MKERRTISRSRSFLQGRIFFDHGRSSVDCLIRDISADGARIKFSDAVATPDVVELYIPHRGETLVARVKWRGDGELGLSFKPPAADHGPFIEPATENLAARVKRLEEEMRVLRRMLENRMQPAGRPARNIG